MNIRYFCKIQQQEHSCSKDVCEKAVELCKLTNKKTMYIGDCFRFRLQIKNHQNCVANVLLFDDLNPCFCYIPFSMTIDKKKVIFPNLYDGIELLVAPCSHMTVEYAVKVACCKKCRNQKICTSAKLVILSKNHELECSNILELCIR